MIIFEEQTLYTCCLHVETAKEASLFFVSLISILKRDKSHSSPLIAFKFDGVEMLLR